jgi:hypothetical protein
MIGMPVSGITGSAWMVVEVEDELDDELLEAGVEVAGADEEATVLGVVVVPDDLPLPPQAAATTAATRSEPPMTTTRRAGRAARRDKECWGVRICQVWHLVHREWPRPTAERPVAWRS